jgi:hypothetical protein
MGLYKWWFGKSAKAYLACRMTGLTGYTIWKTYHDRRRPYRRRGIWINSPIPGEGIRPTKRKLGDRPGKTGIEIWHKDKTQIKDSNIFIFPIDGMKSQGDINELVKARGAHWKITVFIHKHAGFITKEQNDIVCRDDNHAAQMIARKFNSRHKRFIWRLKMLNQSLPKWIWQQWKDLWL